MIFIENSTQKQQTTHSPQVQTFSKIHHMLGHKVRFGKFKKIKIISTIFSDHNAVWLEITEEGKNKTKQDSKEHKHMAAKQYATQQP